MPTQLTTDRANGVTVEGGSVYYSLGSPHWKNLTRGAHAPATYHYSKPGEGWKDGEFATMNMANWGREGAWYSALMRLDVALGFGRYEQSVKIGKGSGLITTFYLSQYDEAKGDRLDQLQEIDFEFGGIQTDSVQTNVWWSGRQYAELNPLPKNRDPKTTGPPPDSTEGWGADVYRYQMDWEPDAVVWSVDRSGSGNHYVDIRTQKMAGVGSYVESLCYVYMSFWHQEGPDGWSVDGTRFLHGEGARGTAANRARVPGVLFPVLEVHTKRGAQPPRHPGGLTFASFHSQKLLRYWR